jgi:ABC-type nitrate/sulfonate/bicarbonate transport system substrate-binding protein
MDGVELEPLRVRWFVEPALQRVGEVLGTVDGGMLEVARTGSSDEQFDGLVSGEADVAVTSMDNVFAWQRRPDGAALRIVAQIERTTPLTVVGRPGYERLEQLRGARILVDATENGFVVALLALLDSVGVGRSEIQLIGTGGVTERCRALLDGEGDATLLGPPFEAIAVGEGMGAITTVQRHEPDFPGQGVTMLMRRRDIAPTRRWLGALRDTLAAASDRVSTLAALTAADVDPAVSATLVDALPSSLRPDRRGVDVLIAHRQRLGLRGATDTYDSVVDTSLLDHRER